MLLGRKQKLHYRSQPSQDFDKFMKIRQEKKSIIESGTQSIHQKVQNFQQLLKLTKSGQTLAHLLFNKKAVNNSSKTMNKDQASKTVNLVGKQDNQFRYQNTQTQQIQMKKLNKMVSGLTEWQQSKKQSIHVQRERHQEKQRNSCSKNVKIQCRTPKQGLRGVSNGIKDRKMICYSQDKKCRQFYAPFKTYKKDVKMSKLQKMLKFQRNQHYPNILMKSDKIFDSQQKKFKQLRRQIKQLEKKANKQYGLSFQIKSKPQTFQSLMLAQTLNVSPSVQPQKIFTESNQKEPLIQISNFQQAEDEQQRGKIEDFRFQNSRVKFQGGYTNKKFHKQYENILVKEYILGDASVPQGFMNIVNNNYQKKLKIKRLYRPKSFAPNHSYIRVI